MTQDKTLQDYLNSFQETLKGFWKRLQPTLDTLHQRFKAHRFYDAISTALPLTLFALTMLITRFPYVILGVRLVDRVPYNFLSFVQYATGGFFILWQIIKFRRVESMYSSQGKFLGVGLIWMINYQAFHLIFKNAYGSSFTSSMLKVLVFGGLLLYGFYFTLFSRFQRPNPRPTPQSGPRNPQDSNGSTQAPIDVTPTEINLDEPKAPTTPEKPAEPLKIDESTIEPSSQEDIESFLPPRKESPVKPEEKEDDQKSFIRFKP